MTTTLSDFPFYAVFLCRVSSDYTVVAFTDDHVDLVVIRLFVHEYCGVSFVSWEDHDGRIIPQVANGFPLFPRKIGGRSFGPHKCLSDSNSDVVSCVLVSRILLSPFSTPAMISRVGVFFGGTAKFSPLARTARSSSDSWHWLRLMTFSVSKPHPLTHKCPTHKA